MSWSRPGLSRGQTARTLLVIGAFSLVASLAAGARPAKAQTARPAPAAPAAPSAQAAAPQPQAFQAFLASLWPEAQARGVARRTFEEAIAGLTLDAALAKPVKQAEFVKPIWTYVAGAVTDTRVAEGREKARALASTLADVERRYGVDPYVVLAIWGVETSYGGFTGNKDVLRSLATLAFASDRKDFFRNEFLTALQILQEGHVPRAQLMGSWAGAMGQTQFMPSSFVKFAVDYDGDRRKNIWTNQAEALASTANYLAQHGWRAGQTWGYEVILPKGFDVSPHDPRAARPFSQWASMGLRRADGAAMPTGGEGALYLPAGARGPAFLITENFRVIRAYNNSQAYMLGVALLSDRIAGAGPVVGRWPTEDKPLSTAQALDIQKQLQRLGYPVGKLDGRIGEQAQAAIREYQRRAGLAADGYATHALLEQMKKTR
ncbi:MAG: lytic murein transglycosylase [Beijerinckiaceae bacterium]